MIETQQGDRTQARLLLNGVTVQFGAFRALDDVNLEIPKGQIIGLLGHNGAGKSTLLNAVTGALNVTSGTIALDGVVFPHKISPKEATGMGISVIHQEPALAGNLSIIDNLFLGKTSKGSATQRRHDAKAALSMVGGAEFHLDTPVQTLSLGQRQVVDLARGVLQGEMKLLLLDEPTAALGEAETEALHSLIRRLAEAGTAVVYVSHRLPDILDVCERIVVLRGGRLVLDAPASQMTLAELSDALAPQTAAEADWKPTTGDLCLEVQHPDMTMRFARGEIVGLYGMVAGDQFTLLEGLYGLRECPATLLEGQRYRARGPAGAIARGVHLVPADRETDGLIGGMSASDNVFLPWFSKQTKSQDSTQKEYASYRTRLNVHGPSGNAPIMSYSGGNRQKHLLMRWMFPIAPRVLLLAQPTQGVDVGAKVDIRLALRALADQGVCVLVASAETDEIASLCNRSYVLTHGKAKEIAVDPTNYETQLLETLLELSPVGEQVK